MNEEFLDYWQSPSSMPFPDSHKDLELWCNNAFLAGAAAMRDKAAEVGKELLRHNGKDEEWPDYDLAVKQYIAAIRKLEV